MGTWAAGQGLLASPGLKRNLGLWDRSPASAVMSPAAVRAALECKAAVEMEISELPNTSTARRTVQKLEPRTEEESRSLLVKQPAAGPQTWFAPQDVGQRGALLGLRWRGYLKTVCCGKRSAVGRMCLWKC